MRELERMARQVQRPWGQSKLACLGNREFINHGVGVGIFISMGEMRKLRPKIR